MFLGYKVVQRGRRPGRAGRALFHVMLSTSKGARAARAARREQACPILPALDEIHTGENKGPKSLQLSDNQATAPRYRCASVGQIPPAHERSRLVIARLCGPNPTGTPSTSRHLDWLHPQKQTPPAHAAVTASAKPNPTGTRMTPAHSHCFFEPNPTGTRPRLEIAALWTKSHRHATSSTARHLGAGAPAEANPTGTRITSAHSRCFPGAKSHRLTNDRAS